MLRFPTRPRPGSLTEFLASDQVRQQFANSFAITFVLMLAEGEPWLRPKVRVRQSK